MRGGMTCWEGGGGIGEEWLRGCSELVYFVHYCQCNKSEILDMSTDAFTLGRGTRPTKILNVLVS